MPTLGFIPTMDPTLVDDPPGGPGWIHEIKYDGYRTELVIAGGEVRAFTRRGHDWTAKYPAAVAAARELPCDSAIIDGEMIVQDARGRSDYLGFQKAMRDRPHDLLLMAFDLIHINGRDVRKEPLGDRRARLRELIGEPDPEFRIHFSDEFEGEGRDLFALAEQMELEGVVSKRRGSRYTSGRTTAWLKAKTFMVSEFFVIGTKREPGGPRMALLAKPEAGELAYVGKAAITLPAREGELFKARVEELHTRKPPIADLPRDKAEEWLVPRMRVCAKHLRGEGKLRHATLTGVIR